MSLEDQISQIVNPQDFTRLCNAIFTACYGEDYQVIDGTRADQGNDGYIRSEERMIAIFCPIKPEQKTDRDYLTKIRSDLQKAAELNKSGQLRVKNWTFITPRKLSNEVIVTMCKEAEQLGLCANHQEATFLTNELLKNKHLIPEFPFLHVLDIDTKFEEIRNLLREGGIEGARTPSDLDNSRVYKADTKSNIDFDRVVKIRKSERTDKSKTELRILYYKSSDRVAQINALLGLIDFYDPLEDSPESMIQICEDGYRIASISGAISAQAVFLAEKGYFLSYLYSTIDAETAASIRMDNAIGFATITEEYRQNVIRRLASLEEQYEKAFIDSIELAKGKSDLRALASILEVIGNAAGNRALHLHQFGVQDRAREESNLAKRSLLMAKDMYAYIGEEAGRANAMFNLVNHIRFFGEKVEALSLLEEALEIAKKHNHIHLLKKAEGLKESIITGKIPDYLHGEK